jgi:hypothetical protein
LQINQAMLGGEMYGRARGSILMSDKSTSTPDINVADSTLEWQNWANFSVDQNLDGDTASDVDFGGFVFGLGLGY